MPLFFFALSGDSAEVIMVFFYWLVIVFRKIQLPFISFTTVNGKQQTLWVSSSISGIKHSIKENLPLPQKTGYSPNALGKAVRFG